MGVVHFSCFSVSASHPCYSLTAVGIVTQYMMMSDVHVRIIANTTTEVLKVFRYSIWNYSCAVCVCVCVCVCCQKECVCCQKECVFTKCPH